MGRSPHTLEDGLVIRRFLFLSQNVPCLPLSHVRTPGPGAHRLSSLELRGCCHMGRPLLHGCVTSSESSSGGKRHSVEEVFKCKKHVVVHHFINTLDAHSGTASMTSLAEVVSQPPRVWVPHHNIDLLLGVAVPWGLYSPGLLHLGGSL